jgi:hypothetical protein
MKSETPSREHHKLRECHECGEQFFIEDGGVSHHGTGPDDIDYATDADHVPFEIFAREIRRRLDEASEELTKQNQDSEKKFWWSIAWLCVGTLLVFIGPPVLGEHWLIPISLASFGIIIWRAVVMNAASKKFWKASEKLSAVMDEAWDSLDQP